MSKQELDVHYSETHKNVKVMAYMREFDWVHLYVADGHYEHTAFNAFFGLAWDPFLKDLVKTLGFTYENQLSYINACKDHHLSWEIFLVVYVACFRELVLQYSRACLADETQATATGFLNITKVMKHQKVINSSLYWWQFMDRL